MKNPVSYSASILGLSLLLVLVGAIAVRSSLHSSSSALLSSTPAVVSPATTSTAAENATTSTIPDFVSAAFTDGDALKGLGADWTFLDQTTSATTSATGIGGMYQTRVSHIKVQGKDIQLALYEANILDQKKVDAALRQKTVKKQSVAGRSGYLLSNGFFLAGSSTTLFIRDGLAKTWPTTLSAEVLSYIGTVRVP